MVDNLSLYNKVRSVPAEACKNFNNGNFSGTDISPMWRLKTLTENFGICGVGWYIDEVEHWTESVNGDLCTYCKIHLFIKVDGEWSKPIVGIGGSRELQMFSKGPKVSDEAYKMAYTDAISVACKALGFGADIYWQNDPTKYTASSEETSKERANKTTQAESEVADYATVEEAIEAAKNAKTIEELQRVWGIGGKYSKYGDFVSAVTNNPNYKYWQ